MKLNTSLRFGATLLVFAGVAFAALPMGDSSSRKEQSQAALERFKALAGEWVEVNEDGEKQEEVMSVLRPTAGGSAVLEVEFGGTDHEMVTVYHLDDEDFVLTHYCAVGNAPHMVMQPSDDPKVVEFLCQGGANIDCAVTKHMHSGRYVFDDEGGYTTQWNMIEKGESVYLAKFKLVRK